MEKFEKYVAIAGAAIFVAFTLSCQMLGLSPYDTGIREGWRAAMQTAAWLEISWVLPDLIVAGARRRRTTTFFRVVIVSNAIVIFLLLRDLYPNFGNT